MKRRTLLQLIAAAPMSVAFRDVLLFAQPRQLTPDAITTLHEIAPAVLPSALGESGVRAVTDRFVAWTRGYREGVALTHGYGHPRLQKSGPSPVPAYIAQLAALAADARSRGGRWSTIDLDARRALLDASMAKAGVRTLPGRPSGQHVVVDLMAFDFRSSDANDECYKARINREVCRPMAITTRKPEPLG
jgi:hypothetical protein